MGMFGSLEIGKKYGRPQLADLWGYAGHQAFSRGVFTPKGSNDIILFVTRIKQASLRQYTDFLSADTLYWEGEDGHGNDQRLVAAFDTGDRIHLFYRMKHHSPFEYKGPVELVGAKERKDKPSKFTFRLVHDQAPQDDIERSSHDFHGLEQTEREALSKARLGQGKFRRELLSLWDGCAVTGVRVPEILRASHIKPWRHSGNRERLDPYNGLLLLPQYDALFDRGLVSFEEDGGLIVSKAMSSQDLDLLGISKRGELRFVEDRHRPYMAYHREKILVK